MLARLHRPRGAVPPAPRFRSIVPVVALLALALLALALTSCAEQARQAGQDVVEKQEQGSFFTVPTPLPPGQPGSIIRSERLYGAPTGARAWRVLYRSTDLRGRPIAVSGIVVAPNGPGPTGGRPVVAWAHPTTGAKGRCAPSRGLDPFVLMEGLHELLASGYVVAATDYSGMGADGPASYLIGSTEGRNVLDAARAAAALNDAHAGADLLLWGHSQGGQAALFAAQLAPTYAPEFDVHGVAVAAPAAQLADLLNLDIGDVSGVTIGAYALDAFQRVYAADHPGLKLTSVLTPAGAAAVPTMAPLCLLSQKKELHRIATPLIGKFLVANPAKLEPWSTFLAENTPGGTPINVPILVVQGSSDSLVKPATTKALVARLCAQGETVQARFYDHTTHATIPYRALPLVLTWLDARLADKPAKSTCPR